MNSFRIPEGLENDIDNLLKGEVTVKTHRKGESVVRKGHLFKKHKPKLFYVIDLISSLRYSNPVRYFSSNCYTHLSSKQIEKVLTSKTRPQIISFLVDYGFIEVNNHYMVGQFSKSYRLTEKYRNRSTVTVGNSDKNITRKNKKKVSEKTNTLINNSSTPEYKFLRDCLLDVQIDRQGAEQRAHRALEDKEPLRDKVRKGLKRHNGKKFYYVEKNRVFSHGSLNSYLNSIGDTANGNIHFKVDELSGRVFSCITSLPSLIRPYLRHNDKPLYYLDIKNSQPLMLVKILNDYRSRVRGLGLELERYKSLVQSGLYEYIQGELAKDGITMDRDNVKIKLFSDYLFAKNHTSTRFTKLMEKLFPAITEAVREIKRDDYRTLPLLLTKAESEVMVGRVVRRISQEVEGAYCLTIHDGIMVNEECFDETYAIMHEELTAFVGIEPSIKCLDGDENELNNFNDEKEKEATGATVTPENSGQGCSKILPQKLPLRKLSGQTDREKRAIGELLQFELDRLV